MDTYDVLIKGSGKVIFDGLIRCEKKHMANLLDILFESSYSCTVYMINGDED